MDEDSELACQLIYALEPMIKMAKRLATLFLIQIIWVGVSFGQCLSDPLLGRTVDKAIFLCNEIIDGYSGRLPDNLSPYDPDWVRLCSGGSNPDNVLWFAFIPTSPNIEIEIYYDNCETEGDPSLYYLQAGIFADTEYQEEVACENDPPQSPIVLNGLTTKPGQIHYLFIDGYDVMGDSYDGSICDFTINVVRGVNSFPIDYSYEDDEKVGALTQTGLVKENHKFCPEAGEYATYMAPLCEAVLGFPIEGMEDLYCYEWTIDPPGSGTILNDPNGRIVEIEWATPGIYTVDVDIVPINASNVCSSDFCGDPSPITVEVGAVQAPVVADTLFICENDPVVIEGIAYDYTTTVEYVSNTITCERTLQPIKLLEKDTILHEEALACGECYQLFGFDYCNPMNIVLPDPIDCNVYHHLILTGENLEINMPTDINLNCNNPETTIVPNITSSSNANLTFSWAKDGQEIQTTKDLTISDPGEYTFIVTYDDPNLNCIQSETIMVSVRKEGPAFEINIPSLDCLNSNATLSFNGLDPIDSIAWSDENGFISNDPSISIIAAGEYTLLLRGLNGCFSDTTFTVESSMDSPVIDLQYQNLNCVNTSTLALFSSSINFDSVKWSGPGLTNEDNETLTISRPGNYQLSVYAVNGCITEVPFTVEQNIVDPEVNAGADQYWNCNTTSIMIDADLSPGPVEIRWEILEVGDILTDPTKEDIEVGEPGIYTISVRNIENGCDARDSVSVIRNEDIPEAIETFITDLSCFEMQDGMIQINEIMGGTAPYTVYLNGQNYGEDIDFIDNLDAGNYQMKILDAYECELNVDLEILQPSEMVMDAPQNVDIGFRLDETITVTHNLSDDEIMSIIWFDKDGNIIGNGEEITITGLENNVLRVELTHINGCIIEREVLIFINYELPIFSPTIFSPNEDGFNDVFTLYASEYAGSIGSLSIFNRWGEEMYSIRNIEFNDESNGWRGMKNGKPVDPAVYTYQAIILLPEGGERKISGDVTLVR